jgi:hypothetical protein
MAGIRYRLVCGLLGLIVLSVSSCSKAGTMGLVEGTVHWQKQPLRNFQIIFLPDQAKGTAGLRSTAKTDENGHYQLKCDNGQAGAIVGHHVVVIAAPSLRDERPGKVGNAAGPFGTRTKTALDVYSSPNSSPIHREVKTGSQTIDLDLPEGGGG